MDMQSVNIFTTQRLSAQNLVQSDWHRLQEFGGQPTVARMMASLKSPWPAADVKAWILRRQYRGGLGFAAGLHLGDDRMIGFVGIGGDPANCAFAIDPDYWGKGYATEALRGLLSYCFNHLELQVVTADHFIDNPTSGHILQKMGFVETGKGTANSAARLEPAAIITYRLTEPKFKAANP